MDKKKARKKRVVTDTDIAKILELRDKLLAKTTDAKEQENIHIACKGLFGCKKGDDKEKCYDGIRKKLEALSKTKKGGARRKSKSRSRSRSKSRRRAKSKSKK